MKRIILLVVLALLLVAGSPIEKVGTKPSGDFTDMYNHASRYCVEQGHTLEIRENEDGAQYGVCIFPDGTECDEWDFFNGLCSYIPSPFGRVR